jgi:hypothetical protein
MSTYKNFTVDFPKRIKELDQQFRPLATTTDLEVSYLLMKLAGAFLLPYERIKGSSGARRSEIADPQPIRKFLELDKRFTKTSYCSNIAEWSMFNVDNFHCGPCAWDRNDQDLATIEVHVVLQTIRHSLAHSNLFFGGDSKIEHVYLGSRREKVSDTDKYQVVCSSVNALNQLVDTWLSNVQKLRISPSLIWHELE